MIRLHKLVFFSLLLVTSTVFGQKRKHVISYKTIYDKEFSVGDRIDMGEVIVVPIDLEHQTVTIPDSLDLYRKFIQKNPQITFKLHMQWRLQGVKYPHRTNFLRDTLLTYFNEDGKEGEEELCPITYFHHGFIKNQPQLLRLELEVLKIKAVNGLNPDQGMILPQENGVRYIGAIGAVNEPMRGTLLLPQMNVLYRDYDNIVSPFFPNTPGNYWLESDNGIMKTLETIPRTYAVRPGKERSLTIFIKSVDGADTITLGACAYRVNNLPVPELFWGAIPLSSVRGVEKSRLLQMTHFFAKYTPEIPVNASFEVVEVNFMIGEQQFISQGKKLSDEVKKAIEEAKPGTLILIESVKITGPNGTRVIGSPYLVAD